MTSLQGRIHCISRLTGARTLDELDKEWRSIADTYQLAPDVRQAYDAQKSLFAKEDAP